METDNQCFVLKQNSKEIRNKIEEAGIHVCSCATWNDSVWLDYHTKVNNGVHGIGYTEDGYTIEEELSDFEREVQNPVYCKDVDEFISKINEFVNKK